MSFFHILREIAGTLRTNIPYFHRSLGLVWASAPRWTVASTVLLACQGILPVITVFLIRDMVNSLVTVINPDRDWIDVRSVLALAVLMGSVLFLSEVLGSLIKWIRSIQSEFVKDHVMEMIHAKTISLDMAHYETPEYYDRLHRARTHAISRPVMLLENLGALLKNGITMVGMAGVLASYSIWLLALLLTGALPAIFVILFYSTKMNNWRLENTANERRVQYYDWVLTQSQYAGEVRLFNIGPCYKEQYGKLRTKIRDEHLDLLRSQTMAELGASLIALSTAAAAMGWMGWRAINGMATMGDIAVFYQVFSQGQSLIRNLLSSSGEIYRNLLFLQNLFEFLKIESLVKDPAHPKDLPADIQKGFLFNSVSFQYPGLAMQALNELDLEIPAGRTVALVGDNGAGKSTIVKLLCRFYDPDSGCITLDGTNIRDFTSEEYRRRITVLFQTPVHYHSTAFDNIVVSETKKRFSMDDVESAARIAGAHDFINRLPNGYETVLSKWFGGTELSLGEWQRLALARAFLRKSEIIILDEPTSSMDSWAESEWLDRFKSLVEGRTAIIITHRFTTAMVADIIHVMKSGKIVESGSHESLVDMGGLYGKSWRKQMREAAVKCIQTK